MMEHPHLTPGTPEEDQDDFRQIKGIGEASANALHSAGIRRFADLARQTPADLAQLLQDKVSFITAQRIEKDGWIPQARALAGAVETSPADETTPGDLRGWRSAGNSHGQAHKKSNGSWHELADFFVSFGESSAAGEPRLMTRVHYSQADQLMEWDGIALRELARWMVDQARLPAVEPPAAEGELPAADARVEYSAGFHDTPPVDISGIWVSQVDLAQPGGELAIQRMIRVEAEVGLEPHSLSPAPPQAQVAVDLFLVNTETSHSIFFENPPITLEAGAAPRHFLHDLTLPPPGLYQLYLLGRILTPTRDPLLQRGAPFHRDTELQPGPAVRVV
jgi:hypothetical protein